MVHKVPMSAHTRGQLAANNAIVSKKRKGKDGHSSKCRTLLQEQKYPMWGRI